MAKRILTWHLDQVRGDQASQGPAYYMEANYNPGAVRLYARRAPTDGDMQVDIRVDGVSIFTPFGAVLNLGANLEEHAEDYPSDAPEMNEGSVVTFHVIKTAGAEDITGHLEMFTVDDDSEGDTDDDDETSED